MRREQSNTKNRRHSYRPRNTSRISIVSLKMYEVRLYFSGIQIKVCRNNICILKFLYL